MEQRPLRLGDIVDDYCTRERRVTNHVVVVLSENAIRQTRCTTCETEHPYKGGKEPRLRKKPAPTLYDQVLAGVTGEPAAAAPARIAHAEDARDAQGSPAQTAEAQADTAAADPAESTDTPRADDGWLAHRQLIRASLPKTDNEPPTPRPIPEFTMYQRPQGRGGRPFRHGYFGHPNGNGNGNGNGHGGGHGHGNGNGNVNGNRQGPPDGRPGQPSGRSGRRRRRRR